MHRAPLVLADAHTHVHRVGSAACAAMLSEALRARVETVVVCATSPADWREVELLAADSRRIVPHYGTHPWWASQAPASAPSSAPPPTPLDAAAAEAAAAAAAAAFETAEDAADAARLEAQLLAHPGAACGEIGLDHSARGLAAAPWARQLRSFNAQLAVAARLARPCSLHCVQAFGPLADAVAEVLRDARASSGAAAPLALLLHSYAGSPGFARQLLAVPGVDAARTLFSFNGTLAIACASDFLVRRGAAAGDVPRGAGKDAIKTLERLAHSQLCFETDAPDQAFAHLLPAAYLEWTRAVFGGGDDGGGGGGESGHGGDHQSGAAEAQPAPPPSEDAPPPPPPPYSSVGCCAAESDPAAETGTAAADAAPGAGHSRSHAYAAARAAAHAHNRPALVVHVVRAAALLRVAHGSAPGGEPLQQKPGAAPPRGREPPGLAFLSLPAGDVEPELVAALRAEFDSLARASVANVRRLFTQPS